MLPQPSEIRRAQQVLLEIARQSPGDEIVGKTKLFKTFYLAHLFYALKSPGFLTEWPIVRMPHGPGIEHFDTLIRNMVDQGALVCEPTFIGPYRTTRFRAVGELADGVSLAADEIKAIREAVEFTAARTAEQLSSLTHEYSRAWNESDEMGEQLNIYKDLLDEAEGQRLQQRVSEVGAELDELWEGEG